MPYPVQDLPGTARRVRSPLDSRTRQPVPAFWRREHPSPWILFWDGAGGRNRTDTS